MHIKEARRPKMAQLVDEDHHSDQDQEPENALKECHMDLDPYRSGRGGLAGSQLAGQRT